VADWAKSPILLDPLGSRLCPLVIGPAQIPLVSDVATACAHPEQLVLSALAHGKGPDGLPPIGPAWREVSAKYRGQKDAAAKLTHTVLAGSNPYQSHWTGKVSGLAMPPNAVAIKEADAKALVKWILSLEAGKKS
jgi:cytochrome c